MNTDKYLHLEISGELDLIMRRSNKFLVSILALSALALAALVYVAWSL